MRIHGGLGIIGNTAKVTNLNLEIKTNHDQDEETGNIWLNSIAKRVEYTESGENPDVIRQIAHTDDLDGLAKAIDLKGDRSDTYATVINNTAAVMVFGQPVYSLSDLEVDFANSSDSTKCNVIGLVSDISIGIGIGNSGNVLTSGLLVGSVEQWNSVTGSTNGLVRNGKYYLDTVSGKLINGKPISDTAQICFIGLAISATKLLVRIQNPASDLLLGSDTNPGSFIRQRIRKIIGVASGSNAVIKYDNSTPLITEGVQIWSQSITPKNATSNINIRFSGMVDASKINIAVTIAVFRNNQFIGLVVAGSSGYNGALPNPFTVDINDPASGTNPITYSARIGTSSSATWYLNRGAMYNNGGANNLHVNITEEQ